MTTVTRLPAHLTIAFAATLLALTPVAARAGGPAPQEDRAAFEQAFLTNTIDHHLMAVEMGELCAEKGRDRKLTDVCGEIVESQSAEIEEMRGYLRNWYGVDREPMMPDDPLDGDMGDMQELEAAPAGREFDVMVSEMFIEHHLLQIARSKRCLRRAHHDELKDLCNRQIKTQAREIHIFRKVIKVDGGDHGDRHEGRHGQGDRRRHG